METKLNKHGKNILLRISDPQISATSIARAHTPKIKMMGGGVLCRRICAFGRRPHDPQCSQVGCVVPSTVAVSKEVQTHWCRVPAAMLATNVWCVGAIGSALQDEPHVKSHDDRCSIVLSRSAKMNVRSSGRNRHDVEVVAERWCMLATERD